MKTVIFDLDGTLALVDKRRAISFHKDGSKNWDAWFDPKNIQLDEPHWPVIETARLYKNAGYNIAIISGRSDRTKDATIEWLNQYEVPFDSIQMRPDGGKTKFMGDVPLKKMWLDDLIAAGHDILCAFEDRDKVVKMWRDNGIVCFQVAYGDF